MLDEEEYSKLMGLYDEIRTGRLQLLPFYPDPRMFVVDANEHMTGYRAKHVKAFLDGWMGGWVPDGCHVHHCTIPGFHVLH